ncbi:oligosaccharide flippase family protein [Yangia mangrovi]|uniref:Oligosaccharide flippase family protein n=1 Tax=Alloyangia mangrovi TaxID=1779329 RepID=A0A2A3JNJ5_9RHOB|nr:oligosaccharide flippase family protein [Alloyangia mangrovi]MCT4371043.1 oligosaccharide flippase family protein [Alloyangia mangrovi]
MIRSGLFIFLGNALGALFLFVRNVFLARLLPLEDYGVAMTFAIIVAVLELASNMAGDRMLVQAEDGDDPRLENTMHLLEIVRGMGLALLLFVLAPPLADFFQAPEALPAFKTLALVPMIRGFRHLDIFRVQRRRDFRGIVMTPLLAQLIACLAVVPLAYWLQDHRAMMLSILIQHALMVLLSHVYAERRYGAVFDRDLVLRIVSFGLPLMINGALMFVVMNGDRLIVANRMGPADLGWFSAALTLALTPTLIIGKTLQTLMLPLLSRRRNAGAGFQEVVQVSLQLSLLAGLAFAVLMSIIGPWLFVTLFGTKFAAAVDILVLLCIAQGMRVARSGPSTIAVATGQTSNPMLASLVRVSVLPLALAAAVWLEADLQQIVLISIVGEVMSYLTSIALVRHRVGLRAGVMTWPLALAGASFALLVLITGISPIPADPRHIFSLRSLLLLVALLCSAMTMQDALRFLSLRLKRSAAPSAKKGPANG